MVLKESRAHTPITERTRIIREAEFPEGLDDRMEAVLSSLNAAPKAFVMLSLRRTFLDTASLNRIYKDALQSPEVHVRGRDASSYARDSLCRIGLVAEEAVIDHFGEDTSVGFVITQAGIDYGTPAAALVLDFERSNEFSIYPIFGQTGLARGDQRAPLTRAKIINFLSGKDNVRQVDIADELKTNHERIRSSLIALKAAGVVEYKSVTPQTGRTQVTYSMNQERYDDPAGVVKKYNNEFTDAVWEAARILSSQGQIISQDAIFNQLPNSHKEGDRDNVRSKISSVLSSFADRQGLLTRNKFRGAKTYSDVKLTEKGDLLVRDFLTPLTELLSSENSETQNKIHNTVLPRVLGNLEEYARITFDLYYPYSRSFSTRNREEIDSAVEWALGESGESGYTSQYLSEELAVGELKTRRILLGLIGSGKATRQLRNGVYYYSLKS